MKRDFDVVIVDLDGEPIKMVNKSEDTRIVPDPEETESSKDMTVGNAISQALIMGKPDGSNMKENITRYHLAKKVHQGGVQEVKNDDLELAKKSVGQVFGPLVIGQVSDWCDTDYTPKEKATESE